MNLLTPPHYYYIVFVKRAELQSSDALFAYLQEDLGVGMKKLLDVGICEQ